MTENHDRDLDPGIAKGLMGCLLLAHIALGTLVLVMLAILTYHLVWS